MNITTNLFQPTKTRIEIAPDTEGTALIRPFIASSPDLSEDYSDNIVVKEGTIDEEVKALIKAKIKEYIKQITATEKYTEEISITKEGQLDGVDAKK